jgi:hypothetical protein
VRQAWPFLRDVNAASPMGIFYVQVTWRTRKQSSSPRPLCLVLLSLAEVQASLCGWMSHTTLLVKAEPPSRVAEPPNAAHLGFYYFAVPRKPCYEYVQSSLRVRGAPTFRTGCQDRMLKCW